MNETDDYLVWSNEHHGWWGPGSCGYTKNLYEAGHYTRAQALKICRAAIPTAMHIGMISEIPIRLADVEAFMEGEMIPQAITERRR